MSRHDIDFVALDLAGKGDRGRRSTTPWRNCWIIARASSLLISSSWAICSPERFKPIKYRQATQVFSGWWWPAKIVPVRSSNRLPQLRHS